MHHVQITRTPAGAPIALVRRISRVVDPTDDFYRFADAFGFVLCRHDPEDEHYYVHLDRPGAFEAVRYMVALLFGCLDDPEGLLIADTSSVDPVQENANVRTSVLVSAGATYPLGYIRTLIEDAQQEVMSMPSWRHDDGEGTFVVPVIPGVNDYRLGRLVQRFAADLVDPEGFLADWRGSDPRPTDKRRRDLPTPRSSHEHRHETTIPGHIWYADEPMLVSRTPTSTDPAW